MKSTLISREEVTKWTRPLVVRTDFENQRAWEVIRSMILAPVRGPGYTFHAHVCFLEALTFSGLGLVGVAAAVPENYSYPFLFILDRDATTHPESPILVLEQHSGRNFRAIPSTIQAIENNLSIANMSFFEFADHADADGVFRGFASE